MNKSFSDERDRNVKTVTEEARWLGSFSLPFSTIYRNSKLEGVFPLDVPAMLLGYDKDPDSASPALMPASALSLFVTINPPLPAPKDERERSTAKDAKLQAANSAADCLVLRTVLRTSTKGCSLLDDLLIRSLQRRG